MKTVGLISLGCPKNLVDSEVMLGLLEAADYTIIQDPSVADVLIVNTCAFIGDAREEAVNTILEMAQFKQSAGRQVGRSAGRKLKGKCKKLVVAGCLPQRYKGELAKSLPEVDLFIGTGDYHRIVELLESHPNPETHKRLSTPTYIHDHKTPRKIATAKHAVYIKIAEGCFHGCSFCAIPKIRGKFRSRKIDDIVSEARQLIKNGAKELNLIAQDTTSYGRDLKDGTDLAKLVKKISAIKGDFWIRIMYAYPTSLTDRTIDEIFSHKKVCRYLDIPIQHINDRILKSMGRREKSQDIKRLVSVLRSKVPGLTLRTSLIVGFPGETKSDFEELLGFVREGHFDHVGVFTYSKEEGTPVFKLRDSVPKRVKEERRKRLMELQMAVSKKLNSTWLGKKVKVLVEGEKVARTQGQAPEIDGVTYIRGLSPKSGPAPVVGTFATVKITHTDVYDLSGKAVDR